MKTSSMCNIIYSDFNRKVRILFIFSILALITKANLIANDSTDLSSPYQTINAYLSNLHEDNYHPELAAKAFYIQDQEDIDAEDLAVKLKKIFDSKMLFVDFDDVPQDSNYVDSTSKMNKYILFESIPEVYVVKVNKNWLYSEETVSSIAGLYEESVPVETKVIKDMIPEFAKNSFLGLQLWQYLGLAILFIASYIAYLVFSWIFGFLLVRISIKLRVDKLADKFIKPIAKPLSFLLIVVLFSLFITVLELPVKFGKIFSYIIKALFPFLITIIAYRLTDLVSDFLGKIASKTKSTVDDSLIPLARKTLKIFVIAFGGVYILESIEIPITPLLAGISIGGLAFALAAQDTVKNLFGSVTIFTDQPFEVGDWIVFDGVEGTVEEVGIRSTRVRTFYNSLISIPNGKLADIKIDNMGRRSYRRYVAKLGLTYDTPPDSINAFVEGLKQIVHAHPKTRKDYYQIHLNDLSDSSILVLFYIFFEVPDWTAELEARHEVIKDVIRLADHLNVRFAFTTHTLHVEEFPDTHSLTPPKTDSESLKPKMDKFTNYLNSTYKDK